MQFSRVLALVASSFLLAISSQAFVVVSNLSEPQRDFNQIDALLWAAQSFVTDDETYGISAIQAIVGEEAGSSGAFAEIRSATPAGDMDTSPSGLIASLSVPALSGPKSARTFVPPAPVLLVPNTRYYFLLGASDGGSFEWSYAEGNGQVGPALFDQYQYTFDGGVLWAQFGTENPFHMQVDAAPESESVLVSNAAEPLRDYNVIDSLLWATQSFETDGQPYDLTQILAIVGEESGDAGAFAELRASLPTGEMDTSPAGLITTFSLPDLTGPRSLRSFMPSAPVRLDPNTRFYFMLGATGAGSFEWSYAEGNGQVGPGVFNQYEYTFDGGGLWAQFGTDNPFHTEVRVPEPAMGASLLAGIGLCAALRRRRGSIGRFDAE